MQDGLPEAGENIDLDNDDLFDDRDLMQLISLAIYLEGKADRRLFPRARSERYSDALYRFAFIPMGGGIYMGHHVYRDDVDVEAVTSAWAAWLDGAVAAGEAASAR